MEGGATVELDLASHWWAVALRGVVAILFGIAALARPGVTVLALVVLFGIYALIDGVLSIATAIWAAGRHVRWPFALEGVVGIAAGIMTFAWPTITAVVLVILIGWWALITGIFEIVAAVRLRNVIRGEWLLALSGILSLLVGVLLVIYPVAGAVSVVWVIGAYALVFGVLLVALGIRLRNFASAGGSAGEHAPA
jgi:uncharacterized membrane protein HdeD (DUF308 family)